MPVAQGRHGYFTIGGTQYPVSRWRADSARNLAAPVALGSSWNGGGIAESLRMSRIIVAFDLRSYSTATLTMATAFWDFWLARTWSGGFDDTSALSLVGFDGRQTATFASAKAESFVLTRRHGQQVGLEASFLAPDKPTFATVNPSSYARQLGADPPLMANRVTLSGVTGGDYGFELQYVNNHMPDARNAGVTSLQSWDAGAPAAICRIDVAANQSNPFADNDTLSLAMANVGGTVTRTLTMYGVACDNIDDRGAQQGQIYRNYQCMLLGSSSNPPVVIS